ncbi:hypothetical protein AB0D04_34540 [Streptomyces sp. NPDC048483]|uniref:hypothetical protein n=1 Tax=Streptomyces sp. NPDC048483 TaxID=3154927 RepID=UPI003412103B
MTAPGGGVARWNRERQSWEDGTPPPARYTGPMPPRPAFAPSAGAGPSPESGPSSGSGPAPAPDPGDRLLVPGPDPAPLPGPRARRRPLVAGAAVAVIAVCVGGGFLLWGGDGDAPAAARASHHTTASPSRPTTPATDTQASTGASPSTDLPAGYRLVHDEADFTLAVPGDWQRSESENGVFYTAPDKRGLMQIYQADDVPGTPRQSLEKTSKQLSHSAANPGYEEIGLTPLSGPAPAPDAVQLVYAYDSEDVGERVKVVDCAFTAADSRQFAVLVRGTEAAWPAQEETQRIALQFFAPTS